MLILTFIYNLAKSFYIIIIDFILILSKTIARENYVILIINKFNKIITFIVKIKYNKKRNFKFKLYLKKLFLLN